MRVGVQTLLSWTLSLPISCNSNKILLRAQIVGTCENSIPAMLDEEDP